MSQSNKRIGILTSGGDCPGLNAVIRGVVKSGLQFGYDCVGFLKGYEGLVDPVSYIALNNKNTSGTLNQGGTILGSTNKGRFVAVSGVSDRVELDPDLLAAAKTTVDQLGLEGLICVGGDGSLAIAQQFQEFGINVVGVPKTIDNDLSATAFTFGFDSAVACATDALDRLHTTAASHERIMVLGSDGPARRLDRSARGYRRRWRRDPAAGDSLELGTRVPQDRSIVKPTANVFT